MYFLQRADEQPDQKDGFWERAMEGVDVVISTVHVTQVNNQLEMVDAAKASGVKRFIPCDFGTSCIKGERQMFDLVSLICMMTHYRFSLKMAL